MTNRHLLVGALTLLLGGVAAPSASAIQLSQSSQRDGWLAWHGCWSAEGAPADELLCIVPDGDGVRMITTRQGTILGESRVMADGSARSVRYNDCSGTELAYWSADHSRLFLKSDLTCAQGASRKASGMFAFISPTQWLSVQAVTTGDQTATASVRYTAIESTAAPAFVASALRSSTSARAAARAAAAAQLDAVSVSEVASNLDAVAMQEWLRITDQPYALGSAADGDVSGHISALDLASRSGEPVTYTSSEVVRVVERPVYVHRTYVYGGRYYGRYSPWGYDWYGWRVVSAPFIYVRAGSIGIRTAPFGFRYPTHIVRSDRNSWRNDWRAGRATRNGYSRGSDSWGTSSQGRSGRDANRGRDGGSSRQARSGRH
jgi:hypothetical protein